MADLCNNTISTSALRKNKRGEIERIYYDVEISTDGLHEMARKAAINFGRRSIDGPVTVRVTKIIQEGAH